MRRVIGHGMLVKLCAGTIFSSALSLACAQPGAVIQTSTDSGFLNVYRRAEPITKWPLKKLRHGVPNLKGLVPVADQSKLPAILAGVAQNLQVFWKNFADTSSVETIEESRRPDESNYSGQGGGAALCSGALPTSINGSSKTQAQETFRYLMLLDPDNGEKLKEYRTDLHGHEAGNQAPASNFAKTSGFASLPQLFGAQEQKLCDYRYLGTQAIAGEFTDVVAFAQHADAAAIRGRFMFGMMSVPILVQGVAWIDASNYQIVRMRTDLLAPQSSAGLTEVTTDVIFQEVRFRDNSAEFWLPREVNVKLDMDKFTFTNRHMYSDYELFSVSTGQQTQPPKTGPQ